MCFETAVHRVGVCFRSHHMRRVGYTDVCRRLVRRRGWLLTLLQQVHLTTLGDRGENLSRLCFPFRSPLFYHFHPRHQVPPPVFTFRSLCFAFAFHLANPRPSPRCRNLLQRRRMARCAEVRSPLNVPPRAILRAAPQRGAVSTYGTGSALFLRAHSKKGRHGIELRKVWLNELYNVMKK